IPWHFAAERESLSSPTIGAIAHLALQGTCFRLHTFELEIFENLDEYRALHLAELRQFLGKHRHRYGCLVGMSQVPVPGMIRDQSRMVARQPVEYPISGRYMRIVIRTIDCFGGLPVPTRPGGPIKILSVVIRRHLIRLVIKQAFADSVLFRTIFEL